MSVDEKMLASTRQRVLESACKVFAEKGFRDATIAEICECGGANVAAVNYYFGGKKQLYDEVWRAAYSVAKEVFPLESESAGEASDEERIGSHVKAMLRRIFCQGPAGHLPRLLVKEMAEPTESFAIILAEVIQPQLGNLSQIIQRILGEEKSEKEVLLCSFSVVSQALFYCLNKAMRERYFNIEEDYEKQIEVLADHITRFSLAGIQALKLNG